MVNDNGMVSRTWTLRALSSRCSFVPLLHERPRTGDLINQNTKVVRKVTVMFQNDTFDRCALQKFIEQAPAFFLNGFRMTVNKDVAVPEASRQVYLDEALQGHRL